MYKASPVKLCVIKIITAVIVFFAVISTMLTGLFIVYTRTSVNGDSMYPTLNEYFDVNGKKDIVYINNFKTTNKNDIIVLDLRKDLNFKSYAIKRLIATEGDIVNIVYNNTNREYELRVNNNIVYTKPYQDFGYNTYSCFDNYVTAHKDDITRISIDDGGNVNGIIIKKDEIYVLGDNWNTSKDSSQVGPLNKKDIVGKVDIIVKSNQNEVWQVLKSIF